MENKPFAKDNGKALGIISLTIALIMLILILNWFFELTPYQKLQGLPLMITPYISPVGFALGIVSIKKTPNSYGKWAIITHSVLFVLPFLYWYLGTLVLGV